jgi:hypothetical protein
MNSKGTPGLKARIGRAWVHPKDQLSKRGDYAVPQCVQEQVQYHYDHLGGFRLVQAKEDDDETER